MNVLTLFLLVSLSMPCSLAQALSTRDCLSCHAPGSPRSSLHVPLEQWEASVHRKTVPCQDCHTAIRDESHERTRGSGAVSCIECHQKENLHGIKRQGPGRPACHSCHTRHGILPKENEASSVHPQNLKKTCRGCHPHEAGDSDYLSWFIGLQVRSHGKQDSSREYGRDNCLGCHQGAGAHGEKWPVSARGLLAMPCS